MDCYNLFTEIHLQNGEGSLLLVDRTPCDGGFHWAYDFILLDSVGVKVGVKPGRTLWTAEPENWRARRLGRVRMKIREVGWGGNY